MSSHGEPATICHVCQAKTTSLNPFRRVSLGIEELIRREALTPNADQILAWVSAGICEKRLH